MFSNIINIMMYLVWKFVSVTFKLRPTQFCVVIKKYLYIKKESGKGGGLAKLTADTVVEIIMHKI